MNYQETLDFLFEKLPMFSRQGESAYKKDLTNIIALCEALGNPQNNFKTIHVAGTNGKGSTAHMLAAIFQQAGYKCGLYTSPHLIDFRERIKVNGLRCHEKFVVEFVEKIKPLIYQIQPSFFEITVAMAFSYFSNEKVDLAIIEVGLGGRLDSTNIIHPLLSIITNIGWDHMHMLGNTLPLIAAEKAGIIKEKTPVVIGENQPEVAEVFKTTAAGKQAPVYFASDNYYVTDWKYEHHYLNISVFHHDNQDGYTLDLTGIYQLKNLITVLQSVQVMRELGYAVDDASLKFALSHTKKLTGLKGRWELIRHDPTVIADVAHNYDGVKQVLSQIEHLTYNQLHFIIGLVKDKEIDPVLALLPKSARYYFTRAAIPRALDENVLATQAKSHGLSGLAFGDINRALEAALQHASKDDLVIICGSIFLIAELNELQ